MEVGSNKSLFTLIAVIIFGIFLSMSYWLLQDELKNVLASVMDNTSSMTSIKLSNEGLIPTDQKYFSYVEVSGGIKITGYSGDLDGITDVVIPSEIDGKVVTKIGTDAFYKKGLTSVILPNSLKEIENSTQVYLDAIRYEHHGAFTGNKLTSITLPDSLRYLGSSAFQNNPINDVNLGSGLTEIGVNAFTSCSITYIKIPKNVIKINAQAFASNPLTSISIEEGLTTINNHAFWGTRLKSITIPKTVTTLGFAFVTNNTGLTEINLPKELEPKILASPKILTSVYNATNGTPNFLEYYDNEKVHYY